jgi:hypothetical protein
MLMLNDYGIVGSTSSTHNYIEIIELLQAEDTLIDAIGVQAHAFSTGGSTTTMTNNLNLLAATGLPIYATEMDIDGPTDAIQLTSYQRIFPVFWEHPGIAGITLWGYRPGCWRTQEGAYLIDTDNTERPAMSWLKAYVNNTFIPAADITVTAAGGINTIDTDNGTLQMIAEILPEDATISDVNWSTSDNNIASIGPDGILTAHGNGTVTVTALCMEYQNSISGSMEINVTNQVNAIEGTYTNGALAVYPNPSQNGNFTLVSTEMIRQINIYNLGGTLIESFSNVNQQEINIELYLNTGIYVIQITDDQRIYHKKVVVK